MHDALAYVDPHVPMRGQILAVAATVDQRRMRVLGKRDAHRLDAADTLAASMHEEKLWLHPGVDHRTAEHRIAEVAPDAADVESCAFVAKRTQLRRASRRRVREGGVDACSAVRHRGAVQ